MKNLTVLVGPPGSGKSTLAKEYQEKGYSYINQDSQGKGHLALFQAAVAAGSDIVVDRMGFSKEQRSRYLLPAVTAGYTTEIVVLHESYKTCLDRCSLRQDHQTIKDETDAKNALNFFFSKYERVTDDEANEVRRIWPEGFKLPVIVCDLDGTLCNIDHRLHFVKKPKGEKKDWKGFFDAMSEDAPNRWCADILHKFFGPEFGIVYCSGRPDNYRRETDKWLKSYGLDLGPLYMRLRNDQRQDNIVKEIILDFELLTRYKPYFMIDDRAQVVDMWRARGFTCLHCAKGDF